MPQRRILILCATLALLALPARAAEAPSECDTLAANPKDPGKLAPGYAFKDLDGSAAEAACRAALAATPDVPRLIYQLGRGLDRQDKTDEAIAAYQNALDMGYTPAAQALGKLAELGIGRPVDSQAAAKLYRRAIEGGFDFAAGDLGYLTQMGLGVPADVNAAVALYRQAVGAGDAVAAVNLGLLYETGTGVPVDLSEAVTLYTFAADHGDEYGNFNLGVFYNIGKGVPRDQTEAVRRFRLADEGGAPEAPRELARAYRYGLGVPKDLAEAEKLYVRVAESADPALAARGLNEHAWLLAQAGGDLVKAKEMATVALEKMGPDSPDRPSALDTAAWIDHLQGSNEEALKKEEQAIAAMPESAPLQDRLGDILAALGRTEEAKAAWRKALALPAPDGLSEPDWLRDAVEKKLASM